MEYDKYIDDLQCTQQHIGCTCTKNKALIQGNTGCTDWDVGCSPSRLADRDVLEGVRL